MVDGAPPAAAIQSSEHGQGRAESQVGASAG